MDNTCFLFPIVLCYHLFIDVALLYVQMFTYIMFGIWYIHAAIEIRNNDAWTSLHVFCPKYNISYVQSLFEIKRYINIPDLQYVRLFTKDNTWTIKHVRLIQWPMGNVVIYINKHFIQSDASFYMRDKL